MNPKIVITASTLWDLHWGLSMPTRRMASALGVGRSVIQKHMREHGIPYRSRLDHYQLGSRDWLYEQYILRRSSAGDIARITGASRSTVFAALRRHGIVTRTSSEAGRTARVARITFKDARVAEALRL